MSVFLKHSLVLLSLSHKLRYFVKRLLLAVRAVHVSHQSIHAFRRSLGRPYCVVSGTSFS